MNPSQEDIKTQYFLQHFANFLPFPIIELKGDKYQIKRTVDMPSVDDEDRWKEILHCDSILRSKDGNRLVFCQKIPDAIFEDIIEEEEKPKVILLPQTTQMKGNKE